MENWRKAWRAFPISEKAKESLLKALETDDPKLMQGSTTRPAPMRCVEDWPVEAACGVGYCGWQGEQLQTVGEVEEYFAKACFDADQLLGEPAACRHFLNWFDDMPRAEMRRLLIEELKSNLPDEPIYV